jgi:hypothetical protein
MNELEQQLLREAIGDAEPTLRLRTGTRIDAGCWWRRTPLWLCVTEGELVVLAVARRRYVARVPLAECRESHYAHASGELVIAPAAALRFNRIRLSPRDAVTVLKRLETTRPH